eukprot:m.360821 g.360821  ORF g.360821 m.360821 type:complete len:206 (+) comp19179_c0_seq1:25-642(+)
MLFQTLLWALRPLDVAAKLALRTTGLLLGAPFLVGSILSKGPTRALTIGSLWNTYSSLPFGKHALTGIITLGAPYTGSIDPVLKKLTSDKSEAYLVERPWLKNPFNSVHAVALINLGELASGVLVVSALEQMTEQSDFKARGIVTSLGATYHQKARGTIIARCDLATLPTTVGTHEYSIASQLYDAQEQLVAVVNATWTIKIIPK